MHSGANDRQTDKVITADAAAALIHDGDWLTTSGFVGIGVPEALLDALERRFLETGEPKGLGLLFAAGQGDGKTRGLNRLGHAGLLSHVIGGHWGLIPKVGALALDGAVMGHNLPQGVISGLYRDIAAGRPGAITKVGLGTFVDPRLEGGKISPGAEDLVQLISVGGEEHLFYPARPLQAAFLRGTTADEAGNVTMEREALVLDNLAQAAAVRNAGGVVIVQVERIAARGALSAREVVIPGALVDAVVVAPSELHPQTYATGFSHAFTGRIRAPAGALPPMPLDARKIIARRCAFELPVNGVVNLGIGMPEGVSSVASEEGLLAHMTLTAEPGVVGGQPASGLDFGAAVNTDAVIPQNAQFDFYDGGGLDMACLGMAEVGASGDVNVSRFGPRLAGAGGFINISQNARAVVFAGTFMAKGLEVRAGYGRLGIASEGRERKFHERVEQVTYAGARAAALGQPALYVTERCVFELTPEGLRLSEIAPGVDLERDILAHMAFRPIVDDPALMDARIFTDEPMGLRRDLLEIGYAERIQLAPELQESVRRVLFINMEKARVRTLEDVEQVRERVEAVCGPLGERVDVIATYDGARIDEDVADAYGAMVAGLTEKYYENVTRYAGSAFQRMKLGRMFSQDTLIGARLHLYDGGPGQS